ncbi:hypothetical protein MVEN_00358100 [Mycena venus]|uniref:Uncharacterized protein n=1 Tax=Mycena venus TaxID=2733690 RepID=A0A8H6YTH1_9AGAR|nr:hypothetical protein MVEN_00358100 [Mycena venus]
MHYQTFLECLGRHFARWQHVFLESLDHCALESLAQGEPSEYPKLRSLVCSYCTFGSDVIFEGLILHPVPWSQLKRYHEYQVEWTPNSERQWTIISQLTNVVNLRASFYAEFDGRLCGSLAFSNHALLDILTEIGALTDFAIELRDIDAAHLFTFLTLTNSKILVPHLQALRTTDFKPIAGEALDALFEMVCQRFGISG